MGCIIPNATALVGEFSPKRSRVTLMMCITVGFTVGAALGGFVARVADPGVRLAVGVHLRRRRAARHRAGDGLGPAGVAAVPGRQRTRARPRWPAGCSSSIRRFASTRRREFVANEESRGGVPVVHLFRDGRGAVTLLLWVVNFMNLLILYSLSNWLPTVVTGMGYTTQTAVLVGTVLQVGGTIGTFGLAWLIARGGFIPMLTPTFAVATVEHRADRTARHLAGAARRDRLHRRLVRHRRPAWHQRALGHVLSDLPALDRRGLGPRRRPHRRDRRALPRRDAARAELGTAELFLAAAVPALVSTSRSSR